ncbi:hypothetical protein [Maribacter sp. Hel_I_7]|uniref:hypothetical protein n=1 Tax=Maribacter sp. Hel_I_7 TaxID=1249997 RepID=UPI00047E9665|nr:hypothetical protein [Maribacter sp. Hel_I_7]
MAKKEEDYGFYTGTRVDVTKRIEEGLTKFFRKQLPAEAYAAQARSYPYPIFNFKGKQKGYGVPK